MKLVEIVMPMRKPAEEVSPEERNILFTWTETREVPETLHEAVTLALRAADGHEGHEVRGPAAV